MPSSYAGPRLALLNSPQHFGLDSYVISLLNFNDINGSVNFKDEIGKVWTPSGNAQISTAQSKFGGSSFLLDGNGDYLTTPDHSDFAFSTLDFTIEFFLRYADLTSSPYLFGFRNDANDSNNWMAVTSNSSGKVSFTAIASGVTVASYSTTSNILTASATWYHLAFVRNSTNFYIFLDGVSQALTTSTAISTNSMPNSTNLPTIGAYGGGGTPSNYFNGYLDMFRLSVGIARWTSDFSVPTKEYK